MEHIVTVPIWKMGLPSLKQSSWEEKCVGEAEIHKGYLGKVLVLYGSQLNILIIVNLSSQSHVLGMLLHALYALFYLTLITTVCYVFISYFHYADEELEEQSKMFSSE